MKKEVIPHQMFVFLVSALALAGCGSQTKVSPSDSSNGKPFNPAASFVADSELVNQVTRLDGRPAEECVPLLLKEIGEAMRRSGGVNISSALDAKLRLTIAQTCSINER